MSSDMKQSVSSKKECHYGENCYRRNPVHFKEFGHAHLEKILSAQKNEDIQLPDYLKNSMDRSIILQQLLIISAIKKEGHAIVDKTNDGQALAAEKPELNSGNDSKDEVPVSSTSSENETAKTRDDESQNNISTYGNRTSSVAETSNKPTEAALSSISETKKKQQYNTSEEPQRKKIKSDIDSSKGFLRKWEESSPYNFFLTKIRSSPRTNMENLSISFKDLLDESLGNIEETLQINFMVELDWLLKYYEKTGNREKPLLILYGVEDDSLKDKKLLRNNIKAVHVKPPHPFGHHHTFYYFWKCESSAELTLISFLLDALLYRKMSLFKYDDGSVRVIVHTANLIESDWDNRTQGVWVSPRCPRLPASANTADGESPSNFRADLLRYLSAYRLSCLQDWIGHLRKIDFSAVKVCFVSSVPGSHKGPDLKFWGHMKASQLLRSYATSLCKGEGDLTPWPLVIQCSSIGSLGATSSTWMCGEFRSSLSGTRGPSRGTSAMHNLKLPSVKVVYPSLKNVSQSHDGMLGGACLPYSLKTHTKQTWLSEYLHQWRSEWRYRSRAVPHIKTYMRWHPGPTGGIRGGQLAWFLLTSANLSKAAWGSMNKAGSSLNIMSYEAGVLFLPHFFISESEKDKPCSLAFPLSEESGQLLPPFSMPYDLPLTPYEPGDKVWQVEYLM